jgi:outer membrane murein-binding lipoprotein Lpp
VLVALAVFALISTPALAAGDDPAQQQKIDDLTKQIEQLNQQKADLTAKLKEAEAKVPAPAPSPAPPLSSPSITGPLQMASPNELDTYLPGISELGERIPGVSDLGKLDFNIVLSGLGIVQNHPVNGAGDRTSRADISNAQIIIQKPDGLVQFYLQAGAYDIPALGLPLVSSGKSLDNLWGPLPAAYIKLAPTNNFSIEAGNLPTLIGAEYTYTFENVNIERGLLWNQENAVNRGVQLNYNVGPLSAALSWNNGFYSKSYTWLWGSLTYALNAANSLTAVGGQNLGFSKFSNFAAPATLNNSGIYDLIYTYSASPWIIQPYFQWTYVPHNSEIGVLKSTSTLGGAVLASYALTDNVFMAARAEYIGSTGSTTDGSTNLMYGPGSRAWSLTLTPTYQYKKFFFRPEVSFVQAMNYTSGAVFGSEGKNPAQVRGLIETGFIF